MAEVLPTFLAAPTAVSFQSKATWFAFALGAALAAIFAFSIGPDDEVAQRDSTPLQIGLLGLLAFVLGAVPIWAINQQISRGGLWNDRYDLAPMLGGCLIAVALVMWLAQAERQKLILGFLLMVSVACQVLVVHRYQLDWQEQRDFYWQLYWRAPALQNGTALISFEQPSVSVPDADASLAINLLYHYSGEDQSVPYWYYTGERALFGHLKPASPMPVNYRNLRFAGSTSASIAFMHQTRSSCLLVLDPVYAGSPLFTAGQGELIPISDTARISSNAQAPSPDTQIFGSEPPHLWCYFFERSDLARQLGDWKTAIALYQQANQLKFAPQYGGELLPFIEAFVQSGDWQKGEDLTLVAHKLTAGMEPVLCANWARFEQIPSADMKVVERVKQALACTNF